MKKIAIIVADLFQDLEVWYPFLRFREAGDQVTIVGMEKRTYTGKAGLTIVSDMAIANAFKKNFDCMVIPGGWAPDYMRRSPFFPKLIEMMGRHFKDGRLIASICHGGWILASADIIHGKRVTSFHAIRDDLVHAGAIFIDAEVVQDGNLITSRGPADLPAFCKTIRESLDS